MARRDRQVSGGNPHRGLLTRAFTHRHASQFTIPPALQARDLSPTLTTDCYLMFLSASLLGACLGFLPYNLRRGGATIFLGDSGASLIGFVLAGLAVMGVWSEHQPW
ncbi:MAG: hypothetical protein ACREXU_22430, partial [Gammaproteobacteria bacterium]